MEKVLNQSEIDALVRAARSGRQAAPPAESATQIERWDVRRSGQIGREQLQAITLLHEGFARNLTHSLGAYLRVVFAATLVSAEHLTYREFLEHMPDTTYFASCRLDPLGANAAMQLDLKVAFSILDLLLGGQGKGGVASREITDIEAQILDSVAHIICRELGLAWQALALAVSFEERLDAAEARRLMAPEDKTLALSFEISLSDVSGGLNMAIPSVISTALVRKISAEWGHSRPKVAAAEARERFKALLLDAPFTAELAVTGMAAPVRELANLAPGEVLSLARSAAAPASLLVAGQEIFRAIPSKMDRARAARIVDSEAETTAGKRRQDR